MLKNNKRGSDLVEESFLFQLFLSNFASLIKSEVFMRKLVYLLMLAVGMVVAACNDTVTYAEQRDREVAAINKYIADSAVNVISETVFAAQNYTTDVSKNQFVLFESSGVYMQIVRKGCGEKIKSGETVTVLCRFTERNLIVGADTIQLTNDMLTYAAIVDKMSITNTSGTFQGSFDPTSSRMYAVYGLSQGNTAVPSGWLVPFSYVNVGRPVKETDEIAKVRLIVPHKQGHLHATREVYPCLYDLTFERGR